MSQNTIDLIPHEWLYLYCIRCKQTTKHHLLEHKDSELNVWYMCCNPRCTGYTFKIGRMFYYMYHAFGIDCNND